MRASADRPLSALIAIVGTVLFLGLLVFVAGRLVGDDGLEARFEEPAATTPAE